MPVCYAPFVSKGMPFYQISELQGSGVLRRLISKIGAVPQGVYPPSLICHPFLIPGYDRHPARTVYDGLSYRGPISPGVVLFTCRPIHYGFRIKACCANETSALPKGRVVLARFVCLNFCRGMVIVFIVSSKYLFHVRLVCGRGNWSVAFYSLWLVIYQWQLCTRPNAISRGV